MKRKLPAETVIAHAQAMFAIQRKLSGGEALTDEESKAAGQALFMVASLEIKGLLGLEQEWKLQHAESQKATLEAVKWLAMSQQARRHDAEQEAWQVFRLTRKGQGRKIAPAGLVSAMVDYVMKVTGASRYKARAIVAEQTGRDVDTVKRMDAKGRRG